MFIISIIIIVVIVVVVVVIIIFIFIAFIVWLQQKVKDESNLGADTRSLFIQPSMISSVWWWWLSIMMMMIVHDDDYDCPWCWWCWWWWLSIWKCNLIVCVHYQKETHSGGVEMGLFFEVIWGVACPIKRLVIASISKRDSQGRCWEVGGGQGGGQLLGKCRR